MKFFLRWPQVFFAVGIHNNGISTNTIKNSLNCRYKYFMSALIFFVQRLKIFYLLGGPLNVTIFTPRTAFSKALHSELLTELSSRFSKKFPNFDSRTFPKLAKTKSSENSVQRSASKHCRLFSIVHPSSTCCHICCVNKIYSLPTLFEHWYVDILCYQHT